MIATNCIKRNQVNTNMKEFIYYVAEEEKIPFTLNKVIKNKSEQFVIFSKEKKTLLNLFNYFKTYKISYTHLFSPSNFSKAFKEYNEKKRKVFFISDDIIEKKNFFINSANYIIHYDIPDHPVSYEKRNSLIKNQNQIKIIHILCNEKEIKEAKAIEVYYEKSIQKGHIQNSEIQLPKILKKKTITKPHKKKSYKEINIQRPKQEIMIKKQNLIQKIKQWFRKLFRKAQ